MDSSLLFQLVLVKKDEALQDEQEIQLRSFFQMLRKIRAGGLAKMRLLTVHCKSYVTLVLRLQVVPCRQDQQSWHLFAVDSNGMV